MRKYFDQENSINVLDKLSCAGLIGDKILKVFFNRILEDDLSKTVR